jgi:phosphotransferase system enzyme I (PtsI)
MAKGRRKILKGTVVSSGIVLGKTQVFLPGEKKLAELVIPSSRVKDEIDALDKAVADTVSGLTKLRDSAFKKMGGPVAKIFDAQLLIASDYQFLNQVKEEIRKSRRNAGFVYNRRVQEATVPLRRSTDSYMRQMAQDIEAVANRVLSRLGDFQESETKKLAADTVLVGKTITPAEVLKFRNLKVSGILVSQGGINSHAALIARSLMIPMIIIPGIWSIVESEMPIIVDAVKGQIIVNPTDTDWADYRKQRRRLGPTLITRIKKLTQIPPTTRDGRIVNVAANLELPGPAEDILAEKQVPIGLYRTEFIYLEAGTFPSEDTQYDYYRRIAEKFAPASVVLRTFDLGADKFLPGDNAANEDNPALGWRGIRASLDVAGIFKTQIRAILKASQDKNLKILLPMVTDGSEVDRALRLIAQAMFELRRAGIPFDEDIPVGIMIEVPAAALMADRLVRKVDFVSIGTNDLTQYTLSADRNNARVAGLYSPMHPSVLQLVKTTVDACKKHGKPVAVCGEAAGNLAAVPLFVGMELDQLSVNPARIFDLCRYLKKIDASLVERLVESVLASNSIASVTRKLQSYRTAVEKK